MYCGVNIKQGTRITQLWRLRRDAAVVSTPVAGMTPEQYVEWANRQRKKYAELRDKSNSGRRPSDSGAGEATS